MTPAEGVSGDGEGTKATKEEHRQGPIKENDSVDAASVNMQKCGEEKPTRSKYGVDSWLRLIPADRSSSPSKPQLNEINARVEADEDASYTALKKLEKLNIRDSEDESESGVSSCESDSDDSESESSAVPRRAPTFRKRGPNGVFQQYGTHIPSPAVPSYTEPHLRINLLHSETEQTSLPRASPESAHEAAESPNTLLLSLLPNLSRPSEDVLESPGQILEDEGRIRGFLQTPPHRELPVLYPYDLTCLRGSSPEHISTSDYGSLPGSPYETSASATSPGSVPGVRTVHTNPTPKGRALVDPISTDLKSAPTQERFSNALRGMRNEIMAKPDKEKLLDINEKGNSQLTICLARMAHKGKDYDEHLICAMIDFCAERKAKLLWNRNVFGETPLLISCGLPSHPTITRHLTQVLIRLGHQFEERYDGDQGNSLLHALALRDDRCNPCMREILELHSQQPISGLDINALNSDGLSPLHIAVLNKNPSIRNIHLLIRHGAKPCLPTKNSNYNAVHLALRQRSRAPVPIVEALLSEAHTHCTNLLKATDPHNEVPIQIAEKRVDLEDTELTKLINILHRSEAEATSVLPYNILGGNPGRRKVVQEIISHYSAQ